MSAVLAHCATIPEPDALEEEFSLVAALIDARTRGGPTQEQAARRMKTTQAVIARL